MRTKLFTQSLCPYSPACLYCRWGPCRLRKGILTYVSRFSGDITSKARRQISQRAFTSFKLQYRTNHHRHTSSNLYQPTSSPRPSYKSQWIKCMLKCISDPGTNRNPFWKTSSPQKSNPNANHPRRIQTRRTLTSRAARARAAHAEAPGQGVCGRTYNTPPPFSPLSPLPFTALLTLTYHLALWQPRRSLLRLMRKRLHLQGRHRAREWLRHPLRPEVHVNGPALG